jgi:hypothetical protein
MKIYFILKFFVFQQILRYEDHFQARKLSVYSSSPLPVSSKHLDTHIIIKVYIISVFTCDLNDIAWSVRRISPSFDTKSPFSCLCQ